MRAGGCTVQQALTPEAASIVKQAVSLARRRGHAQVTPLHVASAMLSSSTGLLRAACLQSHSHPLQCKALELCFNVALNRLPACSSSSSSPMLATHYAHHHSPSLSNALVAAFKRAQAHQRRGSVETQQQPLLAVKIELEQLIISILDDPSVSRVMREARFSSTQVKTNVEQAVSSETCSPNANPSPIPDKPCKVGSSSSTVLVPAQQSKPRSEDVMSLVKTLMSGRRSVVVLGECLINSEGVVKELMDRVNKGDVQEVLRGVQFINLPLSSFKHMLREEVEQKVGELGCLVRSYSVGRGAILYLGDLKWAAEYWVGCGENGKNLYCPIENVMREIGKLVGSGIGAFWVMGVATYHTYMKCRIGNPSLETLWSLHPLTIPIGSLDLSLNFDSDLQSHLQCKRNGDGVSCADCSFKLDSGNYGSITSNLPSWLRQYKEDNRDATSNQQDSLQFRDLCKKWNSICNSSHKHQHHSYEKTLSFSSLSPSSSSFSSHQGWPVTISAKQPWREHCFLISETIDEEGFKSNSRVSSQDHHEGQRYYTNPKHNPNSASSTDTMEMDHLHKFKELNAENLKILCNALEEKVSWQMDIIPEIASTILQCRSGMMRRKERSTTARTKEETWLFFQGGDVEGKEKIAKELANLVFGSFTNFVSIGLSNFSSTRADSTDDLRNKRSRDEVGHSYLERFVEVIRENPHRVVLMEDIEQVDYYSQMGLKAAMERGWIQGSNGEEITINDAIIILSCESFDSRSRACSPTTKQKTESDEEKEEECENEISSCVCLDLNVCAEDEEVGNGSSDEVGLLDSVDRTFFFKLPDDL